VRLPDKVQMKFPRVDPGVRDFHCKVRPEKLEFGAGVVLLTAKEIESGFDRVYRITTGSDKMENKKLFPSANHTETQGRRFWGLLPEILRMCW